MIIDPRSLIPLRSKGTSAPDRSATQLNNSTKLTTASAATAATKVSPAPNTPLLTAINFLQQQRQSLVSASHIKSQAATVTSVNVVISESQQVSPEQATRWLSQYKNLPTDVKQLLAQPRAFVLTLKSGEKVITNTSLTPGDATLTLSSSTEKHSLARVLLTHYTQSKINTDPAQANTISNRTNAQSAENSIVATNTLRTLLPNVRSDTIPKAFNIADKLLQLPQPLQNKYLTGNEQLLTKHFLSLAKTPSELSNPLSVKQSIRDSGLFLENRAQLSSANIGSSFKLTSAPQAPQSTASNLLQSILDKILPRTMLADKFGDHFTPNKATTNSSPITNSAQGNLQPNVNDQPHQPIEKIISKDLKAALLVLASELITPNANTSNPTPPNSASQEATVETLLKQILFPKKKNTSVTAASISSTTEKLRNQLQQNVASAISKILLNQLQTLTGRSSVGNEKTTSSPINLQLEIPIRHQEQFFTLQIFIEDEWIHTDEKENNETEKKRLWSVMLCFDLPNEQSFYAQIRCVESQVNIKFWTQHTALLKTAKDKLLSLKSQLQEQGVQVNEVHCIAGTPPIKENKIDYSLIDIKT
ncbi:hypothetical protein [Aurantivibrio plasticivorans]